MDPGAQAKGGAQVLCVVYWRTSLPVHFVYTDTTAFRITSRNLKRFVYQAEQQPRFFHHSLYTVQEFGVLPLKRAMPKHIRYVRRCGYKCMIIISDVML